MKLDEFSEEQLKFLTKTASGAWAFVPPPLPPQLELGKLATKLAAASRAIGELNGAARRISNPYILAYALMRREALISSAIEGTITTIDDMLLQTASPESHNDENAKEANNYITALKTAEEMLETLPISHRVIKAAHAKLLSGLSTVRGAGKRPGEYKSEQNAIGKRGDTEETARYVPPPPKETLKCMDDLEAYINREEIVEGEELIDLALVHYQFEAIHPFSDGNGRIGRLIVTLMAKQMKLVQLPLLHISASIDGNREGKDQYTNSLFNVSTKGDWEEWISYFLGIVTDSCKDAIRLADETIELQKKMKDAALERYGNHRLTTIIDRLFETPMIKIGEAQALCDVTFPTAKSDLEQLASLGQVTALTSTRPIFYAAPQIWRLGARKPQSASSK